MSGKKLLKNLKTFLYKRSGDKIIDKIVSTEEAPAEITDNGWVMTAAEFVTKETMPEGMKDDVSLMAVMSAADETCVLRNKLLNIGKITDRKMLVDLGFKLFGLEFHDNVGCRGIKKIIIEAEAEKGQWLSVSTRPLELV